MLQVSAVAYLARVVFRLQYVTNTSVMTLLMVRVKLYLEQFGKSSCIVNAELPAKSRCHIVAQFNSGMYDIVIASDDSNLEEGASKTSKR